MLTQYKLNINSSNPTCTLKSYKLSYILRQDKLMQTMYVQQLQGLLKFLLNYRMSHEAVITNF